MDRIQRITVNMSQLVRRDELDGRAVLVFPAVLINEGVHQGVYYPPDQLQHSVPAWNGVPVRLDHPQVNGKPVSANHPQLEGSHLGRVFNAKWNARKSRLDAEVWVFEDKLATYGPEVLEALESDRMMEVSTGLFTDMDGQPGVWRDEPYEGVVVNYRPDHFALLPNGVGACSIEDGAGAPRVNARATARTPEYAGTEDADWSAVDKTLENYLAGYYRANPDAEQPEDEAAERIDTMPAAARSWIAAKSLLGDATAETFAELLFFPVVNPSTNSLNRNALVAVLGGRGAQADIPEDALASARAEARRLLEEEYGEEPTENKRRTIMQSLRDAFTAFFGRTNEESFQDIAEALLRRITIDIDTAGKTSWVEEVFEDYFIYSVHEEDAVEEPRLYRQGYTVDDAGRIELVDEPVEVRRVTEYVTTENKQETGMERKEQIDALVANESAPFAEEDREYLVGLSDERFAEFAAKFEANEDATPEPDDEPKPERDEESPAPDANKAADEQALQSAEEFITNSGMHPEVAEALREKLGDVRSERAKLTASITANSDYESAELEGRPLAELRKLNTLATAKKPVDYSVNGVGAEDVRANFDNAAPSISAALAAKNK